MAALEAARVVGVLRAASAEAALSLAERAIAAGLRAIEITYTIPEAGRVIEELANRHPELEVGAGTVTTGEQAAAACEAGASFLVSPHFAGAVHETARRRGVPYVPGALTPSEVTAAAAAGGGMVKVFPVARLGGASYVRDLLGPYPELVLMVTGGVSLDSAADYLRAGARVVGIGSLFGLEPAALGEALAAL